MADSLRILVRAAANRREIAVLDEGKLAEYTLETEAEGSLVNAVILGRVENVVPSMKAAFVKIGQVLNGFLPLSEMESFRQTTGGKPLISNEDVIVQVKKDAKGEKGAYLSQDIALPGVYLIYMPLNRYVGVSQRVTDERERDMLVSLGRELGNGEYGLIMRYAALHAEREELEKELTALRAVWVELQKKAVFLKPPAVLYQEPTALTALLRDYAPRYQIAVTCNDAVNRMPSPPAGLMWEQVNNVELDAQWQSARVEEELLQALSRRVELKNGGTLVIDEREALSTVDVNSGTYLGEKGSALAFKQNLAACGEIARQIRLRNISGIIIVDFIDMETDAERSQVIERFKAELSRDRAKAVIHGFTSLGLLEMTRKRTGVSLRERLEKPCSVCHGTGYRPAEPKTERAHRSENETKKGKDARA